MMFLKRYVVKVVRHHLQFYALCDIHWSHVLRYVIAESPVNRLTICMVSAGAKYLVG